MCIPYTEIIINNIRWMSLLELNSQGSKSYSNNINRKCHGRYKHFSTFLVDYLLI